MTAFVRAFVFCDGCGQPLDNDTVPSARSISEALRDAKRRSWVRKRGGRDLCEGCAAGARQDGAQQPGLRERHRAAWNALTPDEQAARLAELDADDEQDGAQR